MFGLGFLGWGYYSLHYFIVCLEGGKGWFLVGATAPKTQYFDAPFALQWVISLSWKMSNSGKILNQTSDINEPDRLQVSQKEFSTSGPK